MIISAPPRAVNPACSLTLSLQLLNGFGPCVEACFDYNRDRRGASSQLLVAGSRAVADLGVVGTRVAHPRMQTRWTSAITRTAIHRDLAVGHPALPDHLSH